MNVLLLIALAQAAPPPPDESALRPVQVASAAGTFNQKWLDRLTPEQVEALTPGKGRLATGAAAQTPLAEVVRVIKLLPRPQVAFIDYGCGYDARWCIAAAEEWKCKVVGVELDPQRAAAARERVKHLGLDNLVTIVEGDATTVDVKGDVGVVYLYPEVLIKLRPKLKRLRAFASYQHAVDGVLMSRNGESWIYTSGQMALAPTRTEYAPRGVAVWGGTTYNAPICNSPNCAMCNSIRWQLGVR